jgi:hypothetical protein
VKKKSHASIATKTKKRIPEKMPPKKKATKKGGFLPLLMLPGGLMGLTALMSKMGPQGSGLVGGRRKR